ncbi:AmmeMemoRadiSam system protein A [Methylomonas montana]|uniref:AmmeMemoRadiSam system protein A n=1 Tax=Methylomonas montana TaxID=3058963 RepID=UPI00265A7ACF|nr:AmmeMemoRadiSam system protein A [Methylomonas montana]WKJ91668.1 AmmeMemoRadiSam system protein A [Methylomonas montana]
MSLTKAQQNQLLALARQSIAHGLQTGRPLAIDLDDYPTELCQVRATFVTLERRGQLRGCIGMLEALRPLAEDVAENAFAAAFRDRRFPPLAADELADLDLHISVLSPTEAIGFTSEADLISQLRPGIDGVILQEGGRRGTFLPSVWDDLPEPSEFLKHLKQKAGLPPSYWSDTLQAYRYTTEMFG